ncbi:MAG: hypothetical protein MK066_15180 [Crocinitomicaceae bacterium]|nr:hypothetical protein [Crocinitomicaceae bacterium]
MSRITIIFLITVLQNFSYGQNIHLCYEPIKQDVISGEWDNIDSHLDSMYNKYSDSIIVPFTLNWIGNELYKIQDFNQLYKYSKLMLEYDYKKLKTRFPEKSRTKWDSYCKYLPTQRIKNWGHFYLASSYLDRKQYDSCLLHLDSSSIENFTSIPRRYTYNVSAGIHVSFMKSICFEGKGQLDEARKILIPYLFLDKFPDVRNYYGHSDIVNQYIKLLEQSKIDSTLRFSISDIFTIEQMTMNEGNVDQNRRELLPPPEYTKSNDSIITPSGWSTFKRSPVGNYIRIEDIYVRICRDYNRELGGSVDLSLEEYIKRTEFYRLYYERN